MSARARNSRGYVLLLVAVVVALLSLVLLAVARAQGDLSPALRLQAGAVERARLAQSAAARVAFLLLTEPIGARSVLVGGAAGMAAALERGAVRELRLDGRFYALGEAFAGVQDEAGLLNLNAGDDVALGGLLQQVGVQSGLAQRLSAALGDYIDADDLHRQFGAERDAYARLGLPGPSNAPLVNRWGALSALSWGGLEEAEREALWRLSTVAPGDMALNLNTAPLPVLSAVLGDAGRAEMLVEQRDLQPLAGAEQSEGLTGVRTSAAGVVLAHEPGQAFRLTLAFAAPSGWREIEGQLVLAGPEAEQPVYWREAGRERARSGNLNSTERLPESAALRAP